MFVLNGNIHIELLHVEIAERADVGKQLEMQRGSAAQWLSRGPSGCRACVQARPLLLSASGKRPASLGLSVHTFVPLS